MVFGSQYLTKNEGSYWEEAKIFEEGFIGYDGNIVGLSEIKAD